MEIKDWINVAAIVSAKQIDNLKNNNKLRHIGSDKGGLWEAVE